MLGFRHSLGPKSPLRSGGQHRETSSDLFLVRTSSVLVRARLESVHRFPKVSDPPELSTMGVWELLVLIARFQRSKVRPIWVVSPTRLRGAGHSALPNLGHLILRQLQGATCSCQVSRTRNLWRAYYLHCLINCHFGLLRSFFFYLGHSKESLFL